MSSSLFPTTAEGASSGAELVTSDGRTLSLVAARLVGEATGGIARLILEQTFANHFQEILKVTYRMPLPADGAVSGYEFVIGERTVKGVVDKKQRARERFETAIAAGHTAALLEQERADIFTQQIGNIPAGERVTARITIDQRLAWLPEGEWELRFPTVIGPRYIGTADSIADAKATHVKVVDQPLGVKFQIAFTIKDQIVAGAKANSPTHALTMKGNVVELTSGARLDRDIVVRWPVAAAAPGLALDVSRRPSGDAYGLVTIVPPARAVRAKPVPRDLLVLIDTSGSMGGAPLEKAQQVLSLMISTLVEGDRLEMIEFSDSPRRWRDEPAVADEKTKAAAIKWINARSANGGTEMRTAVIESLKTLRIGAQRQVVLATDGYVGGEQQILEALHRKLPASCRLHFLGVGSAVNRSIATALARAGRGAEVIVGPDEDAERGAKRLLDRTKLPMLTNVEIQGSALLRHAPEKLGDVFENSPMIAALALAPEGGELIVRGRTADEDWVQTIRVPATREGQGNQAIAALYGRERVADVEASSMFDSRNGDIEELGLTYQIATKMTSWVAVDESAIVKGPYREQVVPQEIPYGTSAQAFGLRAPSSMMLGGMASYQADDESEFSADRLMQVPMAPSGMVSRSASFGYGGASTRTGGRAPAPADDEFGEEEATGKELSLEKPMAQPAMPQSIAPPPPERRAATDRGFTGPKKVHVAPQSQMPQMQMPPAREDEPQWFAPPTPTKTDRTRLWIAISILAALGLLALLWWLLFA